MSRCMAKLLIALVPWISFWVLVILLAAGLASGPIGWIIIGLAASLGLSVALLWWAFNKCD